MSANRFDTFARALIAGSSRRRTLGALAGSAVGLLGLGGADDAAAAGGRCKPKCGTCERCRRGSCRRTQKGRRCKPGRCTPKPNNAPCGECRVCQRGECVAVADGTRCGLPGAFGRQCLGGRCRCGAPFEECNGACVVPCPDEMVLNPVTCSCCLVEVEICSQNAECCSGRCREFPFNPPRSQCVSLSVGSQCDFDAQCETNNCQDGRCAA
jgi:hypothetical protein